MAPSAIPITDATFGSSEINGHQNVASNTNDANGTNGTNGVNDANLKAEKLAPIAIVGMGCRLPGDVSTPDEFWELCSRARSGCKLSDAQYLFYVMKLNA